MTQAVSRWSFTQRSVFFLGSVQVNFVVEVTLEDALTLWPGAGHLQFSTPFILNVIYFMNQEG